MKPYFAVLFSVLFSQQKAQQKKDKQGGTKKKGDGGKTNIQSSGNKGACFQCGGSGHFTLLPPHSKQAPLLPEDCLLSQHSKEVFKPNGGEEDLGPPPTKKKEAATATQEPDLEEEAIPEDGNEQD